jgi:hypothetical protein
MATLFPYLNGYSVLTWREPHGVTKGRHFPVELPRCRFFLAAASVGL